MVSKERWDIIVELDSHYKGPFVFGDSICQAMVLEGKKREED